MPRPDEGLIHEWLDGELSPEEAARVEEMVRTDAEWAAAAAEARGLVAASSRILSALDTVAGDVIPAGSTASGVKPVAAITARPRARFTVQPWMRAAAGIAIVVSGTVFVLQRTGRVTEQVVADATAPAIVAESSFAARATAAPTDVPAVAPAVAPAAAPAAAPAPVAASRREAPPPVAVPTPAPIPEPVQTRLEAQSAPPAQIQALAEARERDLREREVRQALDARVDSALRARSADAAPAALSSPTSGNVAALRRGAAGVAAGGASAVAAKALAAQTLEGCWRAASGVPADTLLRALPIVRSVLDTLELRLDAAGRTATVVRDGDVLRGTVRAGAVGALARVATTPWRAERRSCPD